MALCKAVVRGSRRQRALVWARMAAQHEAQNTLAWGIKDEGRTAWKRRAARSFKRQGRARLTGAAAHPSRASANTTRRRLEALQRAHQQVLSRSSGAWHAQDRHLPCALIFTSNGENTQRLKGFRPTHGDRSCNVCGSARRSGNQSYPFFNLFWARNQSSWSDPKGQPRSCQNLYARAAISS